MGQVKASAFLDVECAAERQFGGTFVHSSSGRDIGYIQGVTFNVTLPSIPLVQGEAAVLGAPILLVSYPADLTNDFQKTPGVITGLGDSLYPGHIIYCYLNK